MAKLTSAIICKIHGSIPYSLRSLIYIPSFSLLWLWSVPPTQAPLKYFCLQILSQFWAYCFSDTLSSTSYQLATQVGVATIMSASKQICRQAAYRNSTRWIKIFPLHLDIQQQRRTTTPHFARMEHRSDKSGIHSNWHSALPLGPTDERTQCLNPFFPSQGRIWLITLTVFSHGSNLAQYACKRSSPIYQD